MGFIRAPVRLFPPADGREPAEVEALVDTGAIFSLIPAPILGQLGVQPSGRRVFRSIEGRPIEREVGVVQMEVQGRQPPGPVPVIFGDEGDSPVLGVTALETMGLEVDPAGGVVRPTDLLMLAAIADRRQCLHGRIDEKGTKR